MLAFAMPSPVMLMEMVTVVVWLRTSPMSMCGGIRHQAFVQHAVHPNASHGRVFEATSVARHVGPIPL